MSYSKPLKNNCNKPFNLLSGILSNTVLILIFIYQNTLAGLVGGRCRFTPSCSCYAREAFLAFGFRRGLAKTLKRVGRCHPWGGFGYDPVITSENNNTYTSSVNSLRRS